MGWYTTHIEVKDIVKCVKKKKKNRDIEDDVHYSIICKPFCCCCFLTEWADLYDETVETCPNFKFPVKQKGVSELCPHWLLMSHVLENDVSNLRQEDFQ